MHIVPPVPHAPRHRYLAWTFFFGLCVSPPVFAAEPVALTAEQLAPIQHAVSELIRKEMKAKNVPGLSIALVEDQKILWAEGFGYADREHRKPARADTLYSVGGLSMLFTATALMQLADKGTLELDQPVRNYLPGFSIRTRFAAAPAITPRHLLAHLSGLPAMHFRNMWTPKPESLESFVAHLKDEYVANPPGRVFSPSFPGYDVLGRVLETQCQQAFAACLQERLLAPLGMKKSTFDMERADRALLATHYWSDKPLASVTVRDVPAAGLVSSASELAHFVNMQFADGKYGGKQILKAHSLGEMLRVQNAGVELDLETRVGLGWRLNGVSFPQARSAAWLNNDSPFGRGRILIVPEFKLGVVVLTNSSRSTEAVEKVSVRLMELMLQHRKPLTPAETQQAATAAYKPPKRDEIVGHYATALGLIDVEAVNGHYRAQLLGKTFDLKHHPEDLFSAEYRLLGFLPIPISTLKEARMTTTKIEGQRVMVAYYRKQARLLGTRIEPVRLSPAWRKRLGEYQAVERDPLLDLVKLGNVTLAYRDGLLVFRYRVPGWLGIVATVAMKPVSDTELVLAGTGWLMGETVRVVQHAGQETLHYSGYKFRKIGAAQSQ